MILISGDELQQSTTSKSNRRQKLATNKGETTGPDCCPLLTGKKELSHYIYFDTFRSTKPTLSKTTETILMLVHVQISIE